MMNPQRTFDMHNIASYIDEYERSFEQIGTSIQGLAGKELFLALKRKNIEDGPYPNVTLFEAANRIMSDLVILHGVFSLLRGNLFPFDQYQVELGHENNNAFDLMANNGSEELVGEAFNVSGKFFASKKNSALKKLRMKSENPDYRIVMFNQEAVASTYMPLLSEKEHFVLVDIENSTSKVVSNKSFKPTPIRGAP